MTYQPRTDHDYGLYDCASVVQKAIRRGEEDLALFFAAEMDRAGYGKFLWRRLRIIASEDVGLAEPSLPATIRALYQNWIDQRAHSSNSGEDRLFTVHAVLLLTRAGKSRMVDHANMWMYSEHPDLPEVPDWAKDMHTFEGRKMGRGQDHFFDTGAYISNTRPPERPHPHKQHGEAKWEERGRTARTQQADRDPPEAKQEDDPQMTLS